MCDFLNRTKERQYCLDQLCTAWSSEYRQRGGTVYCGKGCGGCCSLVVNCTFPEAALVAAALTDEQVSRLEKRVPLIQAVAEAADSLRGWLAAYREQAGACPFLDETGACSIYPVRPFSCRSLLSTREPDWCAADFTALTSQEKQLFMEGLDRSAVAFPTHYAATPQEIGRELEEASLRQMEAVFGFSLVGVLPWLVWLEREHSLSSLLPQGRESVEGYLNSCGLMNPFLVIISAP